MKISLTTIIAATLTASLTLPAAAQISIPAPAGWRAQTKSGGAHIFTPPDLQAGEVYSLTTYDSAPGESAPLDEYLRKFAGPAGKKVGNLMAPLRISVRNSNFVTATGVYAGPNGTSLGVVFMAVSFDGGASVHVSRTLFSGQGELLTRYQESTQAVYAAQIKRARGEAGDNVVIVPDIVKQKLKSIGGTLVPGVYAGNQYDDQKLNYRFRLYIYPTGEYRLCDQNDADMKRRFFDEEVGTLTYNRNSGQISLGYMYSLDNSSVDPDTDFCFFGHDANGKPAIYAEEYRGISTTRTALTWVGPPLKRLSKTGEEEQKSAAEAERNRFKYVVAPGHGVQNAQIATVLLDSKFHGDSADETVYLLLNDGSVYADLPVAPDELDVLKSKQREPAKWGKWRMVGKSYKVSWEGAPYQNLPGAKVSPAPAQVKLSGRYGTGRFSGMIGLTASSSQWGVTFDKNGRFRKDSKSLTTSSMGFGDNQTNFASGSNDGESFAGGSGPGFAFSSSQKKKNPNGAREGDYSLNGYVLTLRYDNGKVARLPFFFGDAARKTLWFEGASMSRD